MKTVQPTQFGKFLLLEPLGATRTAEMFRAVDLSKRFFDGFVLLKRLHPALGNDLRSTKILVYEAKVTRELNHPSIVKVLEAGKVRENLYLTEEHPWGRSLLAVLRQVRESRKKVDPEIATYLAIQVCRALDYAHTRKLSFGNKRFVVHRNLSLKNIWIAFDGTVHLYDFGTEPISLTGPDAANLDFRSICALSPEQIAQGYYDHRTDIFSLGTILYELLAGVHPFKGKDLASVQKSISSASPSPLSAQIQLPPELEKIILKCLSKNIENRYPRASTMLLQLEGLLTSMDTGMDQDEMGNWMKNLFQKEIYLEIRSLHEAFSQCLGNGSLVLRSIPAYLFQRSQPRVRSGRMDKTAPAVKTRAIAELEEETRVMLEQDSHASDSMETILIDDSPNRETGVLSVDEEQSLVDNYEPPDAHLEDETILLDDLNPPAPGLMRPAPPRPVRNPTLPPNTRAPVLTPSTGSRPAVRPSTDTPFPQVDGSGPGSFSTGPHAKLATGQMTSSSPRSGTAPQRPPAGRPGPATAPRRRKSPLERLSSMSPEDLRMVVVTLIFTIVLLLIVLVVLSGG
ncbi:MAG: hypothetical protein CVU65_15255 [Deltaproteobacteria bacterium HGW-Deltaproteobacteria-22]|nr:MAG: hypothetical protein CVU65_15255 [Deltaproteobacteria bacterium HGW-Deltaproteobacteria-22]